MKITWMGTACFGLESGDQKILFDPFQELAGGSVGVSYEELLEYDTVFVTHCHFDHLYTAEELMELGAGDNTLFCTEQCCKTMERFLDDESNVAMIRPGQTIDLYSVHGTSNLYTPAGDSVPEPDSKETQDAHRKRRPSPQPGDPGFVRIHVLHGKHIEFQYSHILDTMTPLRVLRYAGNLPFLVWANRTFKEAGEIVAYNVQAEGREILILGSLALDPDEAYPQDVDVLVLPYQGNNDLPARAREVLGRIRPRTVLLSHFDNAFPPMSRNVDLRPLKKLVREEFPEIRVIKPEAFQPMQLR